MSKIIAIWGSPTAGKTTTACKIAYELATKTGQDTILLSNDILTPTLPVLFPHIPKKDIEGKSIGKVLQNIDITQNDILMNSLVISEKIPLIVTGYNLEENKRSYSDIIAGKVTDLLMQMSQMADFVVIDCTCEVLNNELTTGALLQADEVIQIYKPEHRSEVFFASQRNLLESEKFSYNSFTKVMRLGINKKLQATNEMQSIAGSVKYNIPYSIKLAKQYEGGEMFQHTADESYNKVIKSIVEGVILNGE